MSKQVESSKEILDIICSYVAKPSDLLSFALASKSFQAVAIPNHIQYRYIRCDFAHTELWRALLKCPGQLHLVRDLEIFSWMPENVDLSNIRYWPGIIKPPFGKSLPDGMISAPDNALVEAIKLMTNLTRLHWVPDSRCPQPTAALLDAVSTRPAIQELELLFHRESITEGPPLQESLISAEQLAGVRLRRFSYQMNVKKRPFDASKAFKLIAECFSNLLPTFGTVEDLQIYVKGSDGWPVYGQILRKALQSTNLPRLRRLNIQASTLTGIETDFFPTHPKLLALTLHHEEDPRIDYSSLPKLCALETTWVPTLHGSDFPTAVASGLQHALIRLNTNDADYLDSAPGKSFYLKKATSLKSLVVEAERQFTCKVLLNIVRPLKNLTKLAVLPTQIGGDSMLRKHRELAKVFKALPKLTHFHAVHLSNWNQNQRTRNGDDDDAEEAMDVLVAAAPTLRYIAVKFADPRNLPTWLIVNRDVEGDYIGYEEIDNGSWRETNIDLWGECCRGAQKRTAPHTGPYW